MRTLKKNKKQNLLCNSNSRICCAKADFAAAGPLVWSKNPSNLKPFINAKAPTWLTSVPSSAIFIGPCWKFCLAFDDFKKISRRSLRKAELNNLKSRTTLSSNLGKGTERKFTCWHTVDQINKPWNKHSHTFFFWKQRIIWSQAPVSYRVIVVANPVLPPRLEVYWCVLSIKSIANQKQLKTLIKIQQEHNMLFFKHDTNASRYTNLLKCFNFALFHAGIIVRMMQKQACSSHCFWH